MSIEHVLHGRHGEWPDEPRDEQRSGGLCPCSGRIRSGRHRCAVCALYQKDTALMSITSDLSTASPIPSPLSQMPLCVTTYPNAD